MPEAAIHSLKPCVTQCCVRSWEEDVWRIDFEGAEPSIKAVDENGWTYAVDFNYLEYPFSVGGGIVRMNQ
eukprot:scaffold158434_cov25-Tisochrysis_lutea.AAC.1